MRTVNLSIYTVSVLCDPSVCISKQANRIEKNEIFKIRPKRQNAADWFDEGCSWTVLESASYRPSSPSGGLRRLILKRLPYILCQRESLPSQRLVLLVRMTDYAYTFLELTETLRIFDISEVSFSTILF
jgi:hypothetical protein